MLDRPSVPRFDPIPNGEAGRGPEGRFAVRSKSGFRFPLEPQHRFAMPLPEVEMR